MNVLDIISLLLNLILGGGILVSLATLRQTKRKAGAEAEKAIAEARADEITNVDAAIMIWRKLAEDMSDKYNDMSNKCEALSRSVVNLTTEVNRLRLTNNRIIRLLDKITPENLEHVVAEIKQELNKE
jgi:archaellum component FlaC